MRFSRKALGVLSLSVALLATGCSVRGDADGDGKGTEVAISTASPMPTVSIEPLPDPPSVTLTVPPAVSESPVETETTIIESPEPNDTVTVTVSPTPLPDETYTVQAPNGPSNLCVIRAANTPDDPDFDTYSVPADNGRDYMDRRHVFYAWNRSPTRGMVAIQTQGWPYATTVFLDKSTTQADARVLNSAGQWVPRNRFALPSDTTAFWTGFEDLLANWNAHWRYNFANAPNCT